MLSQRNAYAVAAICMVHLWLRTCKCMCCKVQQKCMVDSQRRTNRRLVIYLMIQAAIGHSLIMPDT